MLEMEKSSSQQNLDSVVELATEQSICARETFEEVSMSHQWIFFVF
jgi:centromeric protein E